MLTACAACGGAFMRHSSLIRHCSPKCGIKLLALKAKAERAERKDTKAKLDNLQPLSHWLKATEKVFNKFIRVRDAGQPCISCGRSSGCKVNAGHFLSVGSHPELRFDEANVHLQCEYCNGYKGGNAQAYRIKLIERIGQAEVDRLEGPNPAKKYTREQLAEMRAEYRQKAKEL